MLKMQVNDGFKKMKKYPKINTFQNAYAFFMLSVIKEKDNNILLAFYSNLNIVESTSQAKKFFFSKK